MKTKKNILLLLIALAISGIAFGQLGSATVTYNSGDIETDKYFTYYSGTQSSMCPGIMTVSIPVGATILSTDVSYDMTSDENSAVYRQRSHFRCVSPGGMPEATMTNGPSIYEPGTASYSRTVDIANNVIGGGDIEFELHGGVTHYKHYCSVDSAKIDNNTWTISITYIPPGFPSMVLNPSPNNGAYYVDLNDDLSWDFGANTDNYDVYFGTDNPPTTKVVDYATASASGSYDPGTMSETETYYWQIVSHNANGYTEGPVWNFTTQCGSFTTPFTEDFESVTTPTLPYCWTSIVNSTSTSAKVVSYSNYGYNAPKTVQLKNSNDPSATLLFITPQIDVETGSLADKMVHFYFKGFSYPNLIVGTMSDPTNASTFTPYSTMLVYQDHIEKNIYFNNYVGTDTYIAFKLGVTTTYQELYIDDITIDDIPSCIKPEGLFADNLTISSAWLNWTDLNGASSWNIEYGPAGFTPTGTPTVSGVVNPHQITGLTSSTEYDFYVQTDCGGGDVSTWTGPATFLTPCDYFMAPLSENFDASGDLPVCWTSIIQTADSWAINGVQNYNSYSPSNCYHLDNGFDQNSNLILALPPISSLSDKMLKFYAYSNMGSSDLLVGTMSNPSDPNTFTILNNVTTSNSYQEYEIWFNSYSGTNEYIAIKHGNGSSNLGFYMDNISVELLPSCLPPVNLFVDDITTSTAVLNWTESGSATDWIIEVGGVGFTPGTGTYLFQYFHTDDPIGADQDFTLPGLSAAISYDVFIKSNCGGGDLSTWSGPVTFLTAFNQFTTLPVIEDFESGFGLTGNSPSNVLNWEMNNDLAVSGTNSIHNSYNVNDNNILYILGIFDFTAKTDVMLSFWHIAKTDGNYDHCYVEISTDGGLTYDQLPEATYFGAGNYRETGLFSAEGPAFDEDSYVAWGTGLQTPDNSWWRKEYFDLSDYNTYDNVIIRFRLWSNAYTYKAGWYIDDIEIETLGTPAFTINPVMIDADASSVMPVANMNIAFDNPGSFPAGYTAQVVYDEIDLINENFNAGIPVDWTIVNNGTNTVTWADTTNIFAQSFDGTRFAWVDGLQGYNPPVTNIMDEELISPVVDASLYSGGTLQLEYDQVFDADFSPGDTAQVYVFDGTDWVMIYEEWLDDGSIYSGGVYKVWDVTAYANVNFQVKFRYIEGSVTARGRYFAIDNIRLRASLSALNWLTIDGSTVINGVVFPDADGFDASLVNVTMDATGLAIGTYTADILVTSSDAGNPSTTIPVTFNVVAGSTVSGTITYGPSTNPVTSCTVELYNGAAEMVFSTSSDATGYYEFPGLLDGGYTIQTTVTKAKGGITTLDGIITARIAAGIGGGYTPIQLLAGDVNVAGGVTTIDAILIKRRAAGLGGDWTATDYVFETPAVNVNGADETVDYKSLCSGDINGSFTPPL